MGWGVHEEEEVAALRREIAALEAEIVDRQTELIDLRVALDAFRARYEAQVGGKVRRLEAVEAEIDRCRAALRLHGQWGRKGPPPGRDGAAHVPVGEQYRRTWIDPPPPGPTLTPPRAAAPDAEIRGLYRRLCLRFHPDLTREEGERAWRNEVMIAVNAAYAARDLAQLRAIAIRPRRVTRARPPTARPDAQALAERLGHLRRTLRRLEGEVDQLTHSPLLELSVDVKLAAARGRDLLAEIAADVEAEWADRRVALADLRAQLRARGVG